jgi:YHS domain-containing protein
MAKDPVCHMSVDEINAAARSAYKGTTYYFCAVGCKKAFDEELLKYVQESDEQSKGHGCCY